MAFADKTGSEAAGAWIPRPSEPCSLADGPPAVKAAVEHCARDPAPPQRIHGPGGFLRRTDAGCAQSRNAIRIHPAAPSTAPWVELARIPASLSSVGRRDRTY